MESQLRGRIFSTKTLAETGKVTAHVYTALAGVGGFRAWIGSVNA